MLCRAFFSLQKITRTSLVPSSTSICTYLVFTLKFLTAPMNLTIWSDWPYFKTSLLHSQTAEWIIFAITGLSVCSPWFKTPFATIVLNGFLSLMKGLSSTNWSPSPSVFFWLGVINNAAKPDCILPIGDDGYLNEGRSSGELIVIEINKTLLSRKQLCQKCKHQQSHFDFLNTASKKNSTWVFLWVDCRITPPHHLCIFICHYWKLHYYCTLTSASTLIFLTIWPPICLFFIKSRTWCYVTAYLHALIQLYYSFTSSCNVLHWYITAPLCKFRIFLHLSFSCKVFVIWAVFRICWYFSNTSHIHPNFLLVFPGSLPKPL